VVFCDGSGTLTTPSGTFPVPANVCNHKLIVANASQANNRTSEDESGLWAKCTKVATTFFVFVIAVTAPGSVDILYNVATAMSFSSVSLRIAHEVNKFKTAQLANNALLPASDDIFCNACNAANRFTGLVELDAIISVSTMPSNRVKIELLAGNRVRLHNISKHLVWMG
jgi:hypothetical protein